MIGTLVNDYFDIMMSKKIFVAYAFLFFLKMHIIKINVMGYALNDRMYQLEKELLYIRVNYFPSELR